jgi:hypothetical protein
MTTRRLATLLLMILAAALAGCSGDDATNPDTSADQAASGVVRGAIEAGGAGFELTAELAGPGDPPPGALLLVRGENIRYDDAEGALRVDLTVINASDMAFPEPISLTFVSLLPDSVTVLDADNGETGAGARIDLGFANDDAEWTPGEQSEPRTVSFGVGAGVAVGFVARVDVGAPEGGMIGGLVWLDADEDGEVGMDESGVAGVAIELNGPGDQNWLALTGPDGTYRFDGLNAGFYTVTRLPAPDLHPTTPPQMQVVLVEQDGEVASFLAADFGVVHDDDGPGEPDVIEVGDCLHVKGDWLGEPGVLRADEVCHCDDDDDHDGDHGKDHDGDSSCWDRLRGPVTGVDLVDGTVTVMGSPLHLTDASDVDLDLDELEPGTRVTAQVEWMPAGEGDDEDRLEICRLRTFEGHFDRVRGEVTEVITDAEGLVTGAVILGVTIDLTGADGCDDD